MSAAPNDEPEREQEVTGAPLHAYLVVAVSTQVAALAFVAFSLPSAWLAAAAPSIRWMPALASGAGGAAALLAARHVGLAALPRACLVSGLLAGLGAATGHHAFARGGLVPLLTALSLLAGVSSGVALASLLRHVWPEARRLGWVSWAASPLWTATLVLGGVLGLEAAAALGPLRTGAILAGLCGLTALGLGPTWRWLHLPVPVSSGGARAGGVLFIAFGLALVHAEIMIPSRRLPELPSGVVWASVSPESELVVTSGHGVLELYVDGRLRVSSLVERRWFEGLVQPAFAVARSPRDVLLVGAGEGTAEREILRHPTVRSLTVLVEDAQVPRVLARMPWLRASTADALLDPRVEVVVEEVLPWLESAPPERRFDVIVADLPEPWTPRQGKLWTRAAFRLLADRLTPEGLLVTHLGSPFAIPDTSATLLATVESAGLVARPYRIAVPTQGEWGFALGGRSLPPEPRSFPLPLETLSDDALPGLFHWPADALPGRAAPSTLDRQLAVQVFEQERQRKFGE